MGARGSERLAALGAGAAKKAVKLFADSFSCLLPSITLPIYILCRPLPFCASGGFCAKPVSITIWRVPDRLVADCLLGSYNWRLYKVEAVRVLAYTYAEIGAIPLFDPFEQIDLSNNAVYTFLVKFVLLGKLASLNKFPR